MTETMGDLVDSKNNIREHRNRTMREKKNKGNSNSIVTLWGQLKRRIASVSWGSQEEKRTRKA